MMIWLNFSALPRETSGDSSRETVSGSQIFIFFWYKNMIQKKQIQLDRDQMIRKIYEKLDKHTEVRIWDILQRMDDNDYRYWTCPYCYRHKCDWWYWDFRCTNCKNEHRMRKTQDLLLDRWKKKTWILEKQSLKCITMIYYLLFEE